MRLEHIKKEVWEPLRRDPMVFNFEPPQYVIDWWEDKEKEEHKAFIETVQYI